MRRRGVNGAMRWMISAVGAAAAVMGIIGVLVCGGPVSVAAAGGGRGDKCPYCYLEVLKDTAEADNAVTLTQGAGKKEVRYRCVFCAIARAKTDFKGDVTITAPTETKGKPVRILRREGKWSMEPVSALFVAVPSTHNHCQTTYRALTGKEGFDAYVAKNGALLKSARALNLTEMVEVSR